MNKNNEGCQYGSYVKLDAGTSAEDINKAKELLTEEMCLALRSIAKRDDFFIVKEVPAGEFDNTEPYITVGWKIMCPTVKDDISQFKL